MLLPELHWLSRCQEAAKGKPMLFPWGKSQGLQSEQQIHRPRNNDGFQNAAFVLEQQEQAAPHLLPRAPPHKYSCKEADAGCFRSRTTATEQN